MLFGVVGLVAGRDGGRETELSTLEREEVRREKPRDQAAPVEPAAADKAPVPAPTTEPEVTPAAGAMTAAARASGPAPAPPPPEPVVNRPPPGPNRVAPPAEQPPPPPSGKSTAVYADDFPDPYVIRAQGFYWAFATQRGWTKVPTLRSSDLVNWEWVGDALHGLPSWAAFGHNWAPAVLQRGSSFVMYYTVRHEATGLQCISRATSVLVQGPYLDESDGPLICQTARGGSIDPSPFVDEDGTPWLLWKSEGTLQGEPTRIWVQRLRADGLGLTGAPTQLLERREDWEFPIIEGPSMVLVEGRYHLLYSANRWETTQYAVGHAVCASVTGPCRRTSSGPILATRAGEAGPGGQELVTTPTGEIALVHHAWEPGTIGYAAGGARRLHVTSLRFAGDRVEVGKPWGTREPGGLLGV